MVVFANQNMNSKNKLRLAQIHGKQRVIKVDTVLSESFKNGSMVLLMQLQRQTPLCKRFRRSAHEWPQQCVYLCEHDAKNHDCHTTRIQR